MNLTGSVTIVTGGSGGIGEAASLALVQQGAHVVLVGRDADRLSQTVERLKVAVPDAEPSSIMSLAMDVRCEADMAAMAEQTLARFGRIDALVTCAGIFSSVRHGPQPVAELPVETWDDVMATNLTGVYLSNRAVLPAMLAQHRGEILNVASTSGRQGQPFAAAYSASKAAVIGLSESLAEEVRPHGVRVQVLVVGPVDTAIWEQNRPLPPPEQLLPASRVAELIVHMLAQADDTVLPGPVIAPLKRHRRPAWRAPGAGAIRA